MRLLWVVIVLTACTGNSTITPSPGGSPTTGPTITTPPGSPAPGEWQEPPAYSYTLSAQCGERALIGVFHVEVVHGVTVAAQGLEGWYATHFIDPRAVPTLNDLLGIVARARSQGASKVSVVLDPVDGHPASVNIDWQANAIDDEECYEVTDYLPTPG